MHHIVTAVAVIQKNSKYLIAQRRKDCKFAPNKWEFPGGKVEPGEKPEEAAVREIREEIGIEIKITGILGTDAHAWETIGNPDKKRHVVLIYFAAEPIGHEIPRPIECQAVRWVRAEELRDVDFIRGDDDLVKRIIAGSLLAGL